LSKHYRQQLQPFDEKVKVGPDNFSVAFNHNNKAFGAAGANLDRKSTRLNSSHLGISYAVFCLKKKKKHNVRQDQKTRKEQPIGLTTTCYSGESAHILDYILFCN